MIPVHVAAGKSIKNAAERQHKNFWLAIKAIEILHITINHG
jgi:hypothetical protein